MEKEKAIRKVASCLRQSCHYKRNKESKFTYRFDFVINKDFSRIDVFNAGETDTLMGLWSDYLISVAKAFEMSWYIETKAYNGTTKVVFVIY